MQEADTVPEGPPTTTSTRSVIVRTADPWALAFRIVVLALVLIGAVWLAIELRSILLEFLVGIILASGLRPLVQAAHRAGLPRGLSVLLIYLGLILLLVVFGVAVVPPIVQEINDVVYDLPRYGDWATTQLHALQEQFPFLPPLDEQILGQLRNLGAQIGLLASQALVVARFALSVFSGALNVFLLLLITLYLVIDGPRVRDYFLSFTPLDRRLVLRRVTDHMGERMGGWLLGQLGLSASIGLVTFVVLSLMGLPGAVLLAVVAAIGEVIPMVGPILSAVPAIIVAATVSPLHVVATIVAYIVIQQLENNLLVPKIMERAVNLHPLAVVLSILAGSELLGIPGALVAVPVTAAISVGLDELRHHPAALAEPEPPRSSVAVEKETTEEEPVRAP